MNIARLQIALNHQDPHLVFAGLVEFQNTIIHEHSMEASFGLMSRSYVEPRSLHFYITDILHPPQPTNVVGLLKTYKSLSPRMEELFVIWNLTNGHKNTMFTSLLNCMSCILHCARADATFCRYVVNRILSDHSKFICSQLLSNDSNIILSTIGLLISITRTSHQAGKDLYQKLINPNKSSFQSLLQPGNFLDESSFIDNEGQPIIFTIDSRQLMVILSLLLMEVADDTECQEMTAPSSVMKYISRDIHNDSLDNLKIILDGYCHMTTNAAMVPYLHYIVDQRLVQKLLSMYEEGDNEKKMIINSFLSKFSRYLMEQQHHARVTDRFSINACTNTIIQTLQPHKSDEHHEIMMKLLKSNPRLIPKSFTNIALDLQSLDVNQFDATAHFFTSVHKEIDLDLNLKYQIHRFILDNETIKEIDKLIDTLAPHIVPPELNKKDFCKIFTQTSLPIRIISMKILQSMLEKIRKIVSSIHGNDQKLPHRKEQFINAFINKYLPDYHYVVTLRSSIIKIHDESKQMDLESQKTPSSVEVEVVTMEEDFEFNFEDNTNQASKVRVDNKKEKPAILSDSFSREETKDQLLILWCNLIYLYLVLTPTSCKQSNFDFLRVLDDCFEWKPSVTYQTAAATLMNSMKHVTKSELLIKAFDVLYQGTVINQCRWYGSMDESIKTIIHVIVNENWVTNLKRSPLTKLFYIENIMRFEIENPNAENHSMLTRIHDKAYRLLELVLKSSDLFISHGQNEFELQHEIFAWLHFSTSTDPNLNEENMNVTSILFQCSYHWNAPLCINTFQKLKSTDITSSLLPISPVILCGIYFSNCNFINFESQLPTFIQRHIAELPNLGVNNVSETSFFEKFRTCFQISVERRIQNIICVMMKAVTQPLNYCELIHQLIQSTSCPLSRIKYLSNFFELVSSPEKDLDFEKQDNGNSVKRWIQNEDSFASQNINNQLYMLIDCSINLVDVLNSVNNNNFISGFMKEHFDVITLLHLQYMQLRETTPSAITLYWLQLQYRLPTETGAVSKPIVVLMATFRNCLEVIRIISQYKKFESHSSGMDTESVVNTLRSCLVEKCTSVVQSLKSCKTDYVILNCFISMHEVIEDPDSDTSFAGICRMLLMLMMPTTSRKSLTYDQLKYWYSVAKEMINNTSVRQKIQSSNESTGEWSLYNFGWKLQSFLNFPSLTKLYSNTILTSSGGFNAFLSEEVVDSTASSHSSNYPRYLKPSLKLVLFNARSDLLAQSAIHCLQDFKDAQNFPNFGNHALFNYNCAIRRSPCNEQALMIHFIDPLSLVSSATDQWLVIPKLNPLPKNQSLVHQVSSTNEVLNKEVIEFILRYQLVQFNKVLRERVLQSILHDEKSNPLVVSISKLMSITIPLRMIHQGDDMDKISKVLSTPWINLDEKLHNSEGISHCIHFLSKNIQHLIHCQPWMKPIEINNSIKLFQKTLETIENVLKSVRNKHFVQNFLALCFTICPEEKAILIWKGFFIRILIYYMFQKGVQDISTGFQTQLAELYIFALNYFIGRLQKVSNPVVNVNIIDSNSIPNKKLSKSLVTKSKESLLHDEYELHQSIQSLLHISISDTWLNLKLFSDQNVQEIQNLVNKWVKRCLKDHLGDEVIMNLVASFVLQFNSSALSTTADAVPLMKTLLVSITTTNDLYHPETFLTLIINHSHFSSELLKIKKKKADQRSLDTLLKILFELVKICCTDTTSKQPPETDLVTNLKNLSMELITIYGLTLSRSDRIILKILNILEKHGINKSVVDLLGIKSLQNQSNKHEGSWLFHFIQTPLVYHTINNFPTLRSLFPLEIQHENDHHNEEGQNSIEGTGKRKFMCTDNNIEKKKTRTVRSKRMDPLEFERIWNNQKVDITNEIDGKSADESFNSAYYSDMILDCSDQTYDPLCIIPLILQAIHESLEYKDSLVKDRKSIVDDPALSNGISVRQLASNGTLSLIIIALASQCCLLRAYALASLHYVSLLIGLQTPENDPAFRERPQLELLIGFIKNAISYDTSSASKQCEPFQIPYSMALFLSKCAIHLMQPSHELFVPMNKYLLSRSFCDIKDVPLFERVVLHGDADVTNDQRLGLLRMLRDGLASKADHVNLCRKNAYNRLLLLFPLFAEEDARAGHAIIDLFERALLLPVAAEYLIETCDIITWLTSMITPISTLIRSDSKESHPNNSEHTPFMFRYMPRMQQLLRRIIAVGSLRMAEEENRFESSMTARHCRILMSCASIGRDLCCIESGLIQKIPIDFYLQFLLTIWDVILISCSIADGYTGHAISILCDSKFILVLSDVIDKGYTIGSSQRNQQQKDDLLLSLLLLQIFTKACTIHHETMPLLMNLVMKRLIHIPLNTMKPNDDRTDYDVSKADETGLEHPDDLLLHDMESFVISKFDPDLNGNANHSATMTGYHFYHNIHDLSKVATGLIQQHNRSDPSALSVFSQDPTALTSVTRLLYRNETMSEMSHLPVNLNETFVVYSFVKIVFEGLNIQESSKLQLKKEDSLQLLRSMSIIWSLHLSYKPGFVEESQPDVALFTLRPEDESHQIIEYSELISKCLFWDSPYSLGSVEYMIMMKRSMLIVMYLLLSEIVDENQMTELQLSDTESINILGVLIASEIEHSESLRKELNNALIEIIKILISNQDAGEASHIYAYHNLAESIFGVVSCLSTIHDRAVFSNSKREVEDKKNLSSCIEEHIRVVCQSTLALQIL